MAIGQLKVRGVTRLFSYLREGEASTDFHTALGLKQAGVVNLQKLNNSDTRIFNVSTLPPLKLEIQQMTS